MLFIERERDRIIYIYKYVNIKFAHISNVYSRL